MRKHLKIVLIIGIALLYNNIYAQQNTWTIGLYTGMQVQLLTSIERTYTLGAIDATTGNYIHFDSWHTDKRTINKISTPLVEFTVQYNITDNFSISSGLGYANYRSQWEARWRQQGVVMERFSLNTYLRRVSIQIPCNLRYNIQIKNTGFSIFPKLGFYLDFSVKSYYYLQDNYYDSSLPVDFHDREYNYVFETCHYLPMNNRKVNLLINAGVGFAYKFKTGIGLSVSGEYNVGTMRSEGFNYNLKLEDPATNLREYEFDYTVYNRNEYWNVLFGVTYTFKKKGK